jgi:hypothetical protein
MINVMSSRLDAPRHLNVCGVVDEAARPAHAYVWTRPRTAAGTADAARAATLSTSVRTKLDAVDETARGDGT